MSGLLLADYCPICDEPITDDDEWVIYSHPGNGEQHGEVMVHKRCVSEEIPDA